MGGLNKRPPSVAGTILGRAKTPEDIEFEEARERRIRKAESEAKELREWLAKISNLLLDDASKELGLMSEDDADAPLLRKNYELLQTSIGNLDAILRITPSAIRRSEILYAVTELLWSGQAIARYLPIGATHRAVEKWNGRRAGYAKLARASLDLQRLREAILDETKGVELVGSESFAESIRDGVRKHDALGNRETKRKGWPSTRTIRREIEAILKERQNT
jgi:hypothetical protein